MPEPLSENIITPSVSPDALKRAILLEADINALKNRMKDLTADIEGEIEAKQQEHDNLLAAAAAAGVWEQGRYVIVNKTRSVRVVNTERFQKAFPEVFSRIAKVGVKDAEEEIGKNQLEPLCDIRIGAPSWAVTTRTAKVMKTREGWYK